MSDFSDWQTLIQKHLDGQSTDEEAGALSKEIETNAKVRSDYLKAARIHGALGDEVISFDALVGLNANGNVFLSPRCLKT